MVKKENKKECSCNCGSDCSCNCGSDCSCGCQDGGKCTCGSGFPKWIKPAVTFASALMISGAILTAAGMMQSCPFAGQKGDVKAHMVKRARGGADDAAIRSFIMKNPKVLIDSVDNFYRKQQDRAQAKAVPTEAPKKLLADIIADKTNHVLGNPNGSFVIVEFFDYQCGWCRKTNQEIAKALAGAPNIRWILIDAPIFGPDSERIAAYAMAAAKQGKFKEMHEAISNAKGKLDEAALIKLGEGLKLDVKKLKADAEGKEAKDKIAANKKLAQELRVSGVPMLIVDGKINSGALIGEKLKAAVAASKAKK